MSQRNFETPGQWLYTSLGPLPLGNRLTLQHVIHLQFYMHAACLPLGLVIVVAPLDRSWRPIRGLF